MLPTPPFPEHDTGAGLVVVHVFLPASGIPPGDSPRQDPVGLQALSADLQEGE